VANSQRIGYYNSWSLDSVTILALVVVGGTPFGKGLANVVGAFLAALIMNLLVAVGALRPDNLWRIWPAVTLLVMLGILHLYIYLVQRKFKSAMAPRSAI
jgi:hypothetical protein